MNSCFSKATVWKSWNIRLPLEWNCTCITWNIPRMKAFKKTVFTLDNYGNIQADCSCHRLLHNPFAWCHFAKFLSYCPHTTVLVTSITSLDITFETPSLVLQSWNRHHSRTFSSILGELDEGFQLWISKRIHLWWYTSFNKVEKKKFQIRYVYILFAFQGQCATCFAFTLEIYLRTQDSKRKIYGFWASLSTLLYISLITKSIICFKGLPFM